MYKPDFNADNVQMSDVLCDFCRREWTEDVPFIEGHRGRVICGHCLAVGYREIVLAHGDDGNHAFDCTMCRESGEDRAALERADEPGWPSPLHPEAVICRRCIKRASGALHKDPDFDWRKPE